jgi:hypothetical protein
MSPAIKNVEPKAWLQELKTSRRIQVALVSLPVLLWLLWPSSPAAPAGRGASGARAANLALDDRQAGELDKLPNLAKLDKTGELPKEDRMYRDLFTFEGPPPPPPPPLPPPPPPPPPTQAQLEAEALRQARAQENGTKPADLRYLGFLASPSAGRLGAFMRGEEPITIKQGALANPHWRLVKLTDISAEFQNLKFADLRQKLDAVDLQGGRAGAAPSNDF